MRSKLVSLVASVLLCTMAYAGDSGPSTQGAADAKPDATVILNGGSVAVGVGYTWGHGELTYQKTSHDFSISGVSVVDVGATGFTATGQVYKLTELSNFAGNYVAAGAGIAIAGGSTALYLKNEHGVVIKLLSTDVGLKFKLSADGVHVALKN
jgi:hypothetical protein